MSRYLVIDLIMLSLTAAIYWPQRRWYKPSGRLLLVLLLSTLVFDGWLTGAQIVQYNAALTSGWRLGSVPVEDFSYTLAVWLLAPTLFERAKHHYYDQKNQASH